MGNPIKASDLYQDDGALDQAVKDLTAMRKEYKKLLDTISGQADELIKSLKAVNSTTSDGQKTISESLGKSSALAKAQQEYTAALNDTNKAIRQLKAAKSEKIKQSQLEEKFNKNAEGSMAKLSAEYAIVKKRLFEMGKAQREGTKSGQALAAQARAISQEMKDLEKSTKASGTSKLEQEQRKYQDALSGTGAEIRRLQEARKEEVRMQKLQEKLAASAAGSYNRLSAQYSINKIRLNGMSGAMRNGTEEGQKLEKQTKEIYEEMNRLQKATGKHQLQVGNYGIATANLHPILGRVDMLLNDMGTSLGDIAAAKNPFQELTTGVANFGKAALAFALSPIGLLITALGALFFLIKGNKDTVLAFDDGLQNISKTTGLAGEDLTALGDDIVRLSRRLKTVGTPALMEYAGVAGQLGVRGRQNILNFTEALAKLETASDVQGEEGAKNIARLLTLTDGGVQNVKSFGDELVNLGNNFAATENEILGNATAIAQNTSQYRVGRQWVLAYATATKALGLEQEITGSTIGRTLGLMEKAIRTGEGIEVLTRLTGRNVEELKAQFQTDAEGTFTQFVRGLNEVDAAGGSVNAALEEIGITAVRDQRVLSSLASGGFDVLDAALKTVTDSAGAMDREFETASNKLNNQLKRVGIAWDNLVLTVENGQGIFGKTAAFFSGLFAQAIEDFTRTIQFASAIFGGFTASLDTAGEHALGFIRTLAQFDDLKFDPLNPTKIFSDAKGLFDKAKGQFLAGGKASADAFGEGFRKTLAIVSETGEQAAERTARQAKAILDTKIKAGLATVGELNTAIGELQKQLDSTSTRSDAKPIQDEITALERKRDAILGVTAAQVKQVEDIAASMAKAQLDIMPEGKEKELAALELEMQEKREIWAKYGMDVAQLEEYQNQQRAAINQKYRQQELDAIAKADQEALNAKQKAFSLGMERISQEEALAISEIELVAETEEEKTRLRLQAERHRLQQILDLNKAIGGELSELQIKQMKNAIEAINRELGKLDSDKEKDKDIYDLVGLKLDDDQKAAVSQAVQFSIGQVQALMAARVEAANKAVQAAQQETEAAKGRLDQELEARNNGYANNVATAEKELKLARDKERAALKEKQKAVEAQMLLDTAMQTSSLITASANIWKSLSGIPVVGTALAVAALATMWGSFAAAKIKAVSASKEMYGDGHFEVIRGGSHASGNDVPLGMTAGGKQRTVEGGEAFAVINKRSTKKYGRELPGIMEALNKGTFQETYGRAFIPAEQMPAGIFSANFDSPDLKAIESDLSAIRQQGEERVYQNANGQTVRKFKNLTVVYV